MIPAPTLTGVWCVYAGQQEQLAVSVAQWRRTTGAPVVFCNDAAAPLDAATLARLAPDHLVTTPWPRRRNLNGWEACHGVLEALATACALTGAGHAVKIDCDTLVLATAWIDPAAPFSGFHYGQGAWTGGLAYAMAATAIAAELEAWDSWWKDPSYRAPEDVILSGRMILRYGPACALHDFSLGLAGSYHADIPAARYARAQVLTFQKCHSPETDPALMAAYTPL